MSAKAGTALRCGCGIAAASGLLRLDQGVWSASQCGSDALEAAAFARTHAVVDHTVLVQMWREFVADSLEPRRRL